MIRFAARRLGFMLVILVVSSVVVFVVGRLAPGDPVQLLMGDLRDPVIEARVRHDLGLGPPALGAVPPIRRARAARRSRPVLREPRPVGEPDGRRGAPRHGPARRA